MQRSHAFTVTVLTLVGLVAAACTTPLSVVNVAAPNVNCVFDPACRLTVTDTVANLPPSAGYTGTAVLQSRTAGPAPAGVPGAGNVAYLYRVDLTGAAPASDQMCVSSLSVNFGTVTKLPYAGPGTTPADVFVITTGGLGSVGVRSAEKTGNTVTLRFSLASFPAPGDPYPPVCPGKTSYFVGLASPTAPVPSTTTVQMGVYGPQSVAGRAPLP
ncbi:hypothetical protein [Reyranella soli]|jgi:hypothetical protein|uniref:Lipoprotein n=1 Tax=Reyranella soli TaxID=1230389 RepID=A0A512NI86_9HYPH|nr:hypothetical protein [Reyranella soli]GEP58659.1 hypothetical protein RSO01_58250 [Reyranella soli]